MKLFGNMKRKLISKNEDKVTWLQMIGFLMILTGILYLVLKLFFLSISAEEVAIIFFDIMLGVAFAFPDMLKDDSNQVSTMRIVVFMFVNVICMLLLKIGWGKSSFAEIEIDGYWMGIIGFLFGAKVMQSYFESKLAGPKDRPKTGMAALDYTQADIAKLAVEQNQQFLKAKFPNILSVSDAVHDLDEAESHVIALYLKDNNTVGIPDRLEVKMPDGSIKTIATEIIKGAGKGKININQQDEIRNGISNGSICCIVETQDGEKMVVTAGHVFSRGNSISFGGELDISDQVPALINKKISGKWFFQIINFKNDVALASIDRFTPDADYVSFEGKDHYEVTDNDVRKTKVKVISNITEPRVRDAFILDYNTSWDVPYDDKTIAKNKIIVIGNSKSRLQSETVSQKGDSGGCVYEEKTGNLVGLILGGNEMFTWVLSLKGIFEKFNFKLS